MSEAQMSVAGRERLQAMRQKLAEENAQHETIYALRLSKADLEALQRGIITAAVLEMVTRHLAEWP